MKLRSFVKWAADRMEKTLRRKDLLNYGPWELETAQQRWEHILKERIEVDDAESMCVIPEKSTAATELHLQEELVDEAVTCLIMAARYDNFQMKLRRGQVVKR